MHKHLSQVRGDMMMEERPVRCPGCGRPFGKGGSLYHRVSGELTAWYARCSNCEWERTVGPYHALKGSRIYIHAPWNG